MGAQKGNGILVTLRGNAWLTQARAERWSWIFLAGYLVFFLSLLGTAHGMTDLMGRPVGADFSSFYSAGQIARLGGNPFDQVALHAAQQALFGAATPFYSFAYPPVFLLILAPLSLFSYPVALAIWQIGTLAIYLVAMDRLRISLAFYLPRWSFLLISLSFTAVFVSLTNGQNGLLAAGLFALGLAFLNNRPLLAGACFGLLVFKPQLGLLIPFALAIDGRWRTFVAASVMVMVLGIISCFAFGAEIWRALLGAVLFSREAILDNGRVGYGRMISVFAELRLLGAPLFVAYFCQAVAAIAALMGVIFVWRARVDVRLKGAALCFGTLLATPFALDYDMMILAPGIALLVALGIDYRFGPFEGALLALVWIAPMLARITLITQLPLALLINSCLFVSILFRMYSIGYVASTHHQENR